MTSVPTRRHVQSKGSNVDNQSTPEATHKQGESAPDHVNVPVALSLFIGQISHHIVALVYDPTNIVSILVFASCNATAAYLAAPHIVAKSPLVKYAAVLFSAIPMVVLPYYSTRKVLMRAYYSLATLVWTIRTIQILRDASHFRNTSFHYRHTFQMWFGSDFRTARRLSPQERGASLRACSLDVGLALLFCVAMQLLLAHGVAAAAGGRVLRWAAGTVFMYNSMTMMDALYRLPLLFFSGVDVLACMDRPVLSASLRDFWGFRWDKAVQMLLVDTVYLPIVNQWGKPARMAAGFATFAASGVLHVYPLALMGMPGLNLVKTFVFFMLQPVLLLLEVRNRELAAKWHPWSWMIPFAVTTPLFIEPFLEAFGW